MNFIFFNKNSNLSEVVFMMGLFIFFCNKDDKHLIGEKMY